MSEANERKSIIPANAVDRVASSVLVDCGDALKGHADTMTLIPLMDGDRVEGFEVRCQCGAAVLVDCLYEED